MGLIDDDNSPNIPVRVDRHVYSLGEAKAIAERCNIKFSQLEMEKIAEILAYAANKSAKSMREFGLALKALSEKMRKVYTVKFHQPKPKRKRRAHFKPHLRRRIKEVIR